MAVSLQSLCPLTAGQTSNTQSSCLSLVILLFSTVTVAVTMLGTVTHSVTGTCMQLHFSISYVMQVSAKPAARATKAVFLEQSHKCVMNEATSGATGVLPRCDHCHIPVHHTVLDAQQRKKLPQILSCQRR